MGEMNEQVHRLLLEQRKTLSLGGVQDVKSFDENEVLLVTVCGVLTIRGKELHVGRLELEKGEADIEGSIDSLSIRNMGRCRRRGLRLRGCSGKNECVCQPGADSARLFHLAGGSPGVLVRSDQDSAETDPPQPCGGICRGPLLLDCGSAVSVCTDLRREQRHSPWVSVWRHPWGRCIVPRIVWTLSSGTSGKGNQKSRANPRFSRKMAGKKYEKTEKKVEISWEER